jgi:fatty acid desaturase
MRRKEKEMFELLGILIFVLDVWAIISVLTGYGSTAHKVIWILLIILLPVLGLILYLLFGRNVADTAA